MKHLRSNKTIGLLIILLLLMGLVVSLVLVKQVQNHRSNAATVAFTQEPSTYFPYGAFDDANVAQGAAFTAMLNDLKSRGMDTVFLTNGSLNAEKAMLTSADQIGGMNIFLAPHSELNTKWWSTGVTADITTARNVIYPLVDELKNFQSLKGYADKDDSGTTTTPKILLADQAFNEHDPSRPVIPTLFGPVLTMSDQFDPTQRVFATYWHPNGDSCSFTNQGIEWQNAISLTQQRNFLQERNIPLWNMAADAYEFKPSILQRPEPIRLQNWLMLGEGVKGIMWMTYSDHPTGGQGDPGWVGFKNNPPILSEITDLTRRVNPLKPLLLSAKRDYNNKFFASAADTTLPIDNQAYASTLVKKDGSKYYAIVVNRSCSPQTLSISSSAFSTGSQLKDVETGQIVNFGTQLSFRGGDGKMFELVNGTLKPITPTPAPNQVANSSFEIGTSSPASWGLRASSVWDSTTAHTGSKSIKVTGPVASEQMSVPISGPLKPNTQYSFSYWVKTQNVTGEGIFSVFWHIQQAGNTQEQFPKTKGTTDWKQVIGTFYTRDDYQSGRLDLMWKLNSGDVAWIDDVVFCEGQIGCNGTFPVIIPTIQPLPTTNPLPTTLPTTLPSPTPAVSTVQSIVPGVSYQTTPWTDTALSSFMHSLSSTVITHHAKKNIVLPYLNGLIYEWVKFNPDRPYEAQQEDTMHDGAWFGHSLASAYRATHDTYFSNTLNNYTLTFYPRILNTSDTLFPLGLPEGAAKVTSVQAIPSVSDYPTNPLSKGIDPFFLDDGESTYYEDGTKIFGFRTGKYTSLHMQQDLANMLASTALLTDRTDVKLALKNLALSTDSAYGTEAPSNPALLTKIMAEKINPGDTQLIASLGNLPNPAPTGIWTDATKPPFSRPKSYTALYLNQNQTIGDHLDGEEWTYYQSILDKDRKPLDDAFAKNNIELAYDYISLNQLWYGTVKRQPGLNFYEGGSVQAGEKFNIYYADDPNRIQGSRYATQLMFHAAIGLQLLKEFPNAWTKWRDSCCTNDTQVEIRWTKVNLDGILDSGGYSNPITLQSNVTVRLQSSLDTLTLFLMKPTGQAVTFSIFSRPDGTTPGAVINIDPTGNVTAKGKNGTDDLLLSKAITSQGGQDMIEIAIPYTIVKAQKPWANITDDSRISVKGANNVLTTLFFLSDPQTVKTILNQEMVEGLRFWEFVLQDWGMIPSGFYLTKGKTGIWNGFSDLGGYSHIINAAAAYKEYLDGNKDWDLYTTTKVGSTTPIPTIQPSPTTVIPTSTPRPTSTPIPSSTPVPTATPIPSPTPTPFANSTKVGVTLFLHGVGRGGDNVNPGSAGNLTPVHIGRPVTITLLDSTQSVVKTATGNVVYNSSGSFSGVVDLGTTLPNGNYSIRVKTATYIEHQVGTSFFTLTQGQTTQLTPTYLVAGDATSDNHINILDYNLMLDCYSVLTPPKNCDSTKKLATDFDDDGSVNQFDYNLLLRELSDQNTN